jgi:UDPglucose 6-dehydrogenase
LVKITVVGTGYVGLVSGACLADFGNHVICVDTDNKKVENLKKGVIPIYEQGLDELIARNTAAGRLQFTTEFTGAVKQSDVVFVAVGTPPAEDGGADMRYVEQVVRDVGKCIEKYTVIVDKSTVPVGSGRQVKAWVLEELDRRGEKIQFDIVSNPEFMREGTAVYDFIHPDRVVIGAESGMARKIMETVYRPLYLNEIPCIETNLESAEMIKYASNAFLAVKIAFINEIANLCEKTGADVQDVAAGIGCDRRIGKRFLQCGPGYGGSCFPKDTQAIAVTGRRYGSPLSIVETTITANENQKFKMIEKIEAGMEMGGGGVSGKTLAVLGLAFKNNTNDMRESPAITICEGLVKRGAFLRVYDPAAMEEAAWRLSSIKNSVYFANDEYDAVNSADAVVLLTEWHSFGNLDLQKTSKLLSQPFFFDLRNMYKREEIEGAGLRYFGIGRGAGS